eukprot:CAMPEP_0197255900 /NCGR_PEP_ID=MMETSP1429-20130617/73553_1 /TAXON_ID=49237 /ORGANISM="Chaetoceros  sp., Strain UNC1202" /LENGTH=33 /DNA_ID= /DNA_START= /DNA_END= /DNA_ORIENTATION=
MSSPCPASRACVSAASVPLDMMLSAPASCAIFA